MNKYGNETKREKIKDFINRRFSVPMHGIIAMFRSEVNPWLFLLGGIAFIVAGAVVGLVWWKWLIVAWLIVILYIAELINTSIERVSDEVTTEHSNRIKDAKDMGAAVVLLVTIIVIVTGVLLFII